MRVWERIIGVLGLVLVAALPGWALVYDGSTRPGNGPILRDGSATEWVAAAFMLEREAYATSFSLALSRASGPLDAGFNVWLTTTPTDPPNAAIASWKMIPKTAITTYYEAVMPDPIYLKANQPYFVAVAPSDPSFSGGVSYSAKGYHGFSSGDHGATWYKLAMPIGLKVDGYVVPEPAGVLAVIGGVVGCALGKGRLRPGVGCWVMAGKGRLQTHGVSLASAQKACRSIGREGVLVES